MSFVQVQGHRIEYDLVHVSGADAPVMIFLHEGLGSLSMWKDFPSRVAHATGCNALIYSRYGYGQSDVLAASRNVDFMHDEALKALPELLDRLEVQSPILFGHSDGGSIALICAGGSNRPVAGVIAMAPHVVVEDISIKSIREARQTFETTNLKNRLRRYHAEPDSTFWGWNNIWLHPEFRDWNIEEFLPRIMCPILAIQGEDDEYGTMRQIDLIARLAPDVELLKLTDCRHSPHFDQPDVVIDAVTRFVDRIRR
jgi:pimeloyl-ACP methyl ester carboxylesterase